MATTPLAYQPCAPRHWMKRLLRRGFFATLLIAIGIFGLTHYEAIKYRANFHYQQRLFRRWSPPADVVIYDSDGHLATDRRYAMLPVVAMMDGEPTSIPWPSEVGLRTYDWLYLPKGVSQLYETIVFVRGMRYKDGGAERLVVVPIKVFHGNAWRSLCFVTVVLCPVEIWQTPPAKVLSERVSCEIPLHERDHMRVFPATIDPSDPAQFVIPYELNGKAHTIRGHLNSDDSVSLTDDHVPPRLRSDIRPGPKE